MEQGWEFTPCGNPRRLGRLGEGPHGIKHCVALKLEE